MWKMSTVNLTTYLITMDDLMRVYELAWCKLLTSMQHFHRFYQECHFLYWTILIYFCNLKKKIWKENEIRGSIAKIIYIGNKLKFLIMLIPLFRISDVSMLASSVVDHEFEPWLGKTKTIKLEFAASPLSMQLWGVRAKSVWLGIRTMCSSGVTYLSMDCCFSELALQRSNLV
jgi:hypothetical protein